MSNEYRMLYVGYWLRRFLSEYLVTVRNMSKNTIKSYRDTFKLLLPFAAKPCKKTTDDLLLTDISISRVVSFLNMLEIGLMVRKFRLFEFSKEDNAV